MTALGKRIDSAFMERSEAALASGVPRQELGTFSERLLIPLIHFILLGFLPMHAMRRTRWPSMSAGCGQLLIVRRPVLPLVDSTCGRAPMGGEDGGGVPGFLCESHATAGAEDITELGGWRAYLKTLAR